MNCKKLSKRSIVNTILVIIWMLVIFSFSAEPADESGDLSLSAGRQIGNIFIPDFSKLSVDEQYEFASRIEYTVRKSAHAAEYAVLGVLIINAVYSFGKNKYRHVLYCILGGAAYAATDEFHQLFVPGRSGMLSDVLLDSTGVFAGVICFFVIHRIVCEKKGNVSAKKRR